MIVQYWHSDRPPPRIERAVASFREANPGQPHRLFDHGAAEAFIAERFSPREVAAFRRCAAPAMQADYFRCCAVFALGGLYADADLVCTADVQPLWEQHGAGLLFGLPGQLPAWQVELLGWPHKVGPYLALDNGLFAFREPGHPLLSVAIELATANIERRVADGPKGIWVTAGPGVFTAIYLLHRLGTTDAFLRFSAGTILEDSAPLLCEVVGGRVEIGSLFENVSLRSRDERRAWVRPAGAPNPSEITEVHWMHVKESIFR